MANNPRILIIGAGERGNAHAYNTRKNNLGKIIAVADPNKERRKTMAERYRIPKENIFESGEQALKKKLEFEGVYITTQDKSHYNLATSALEKGYNVLLEKPMATTPKECIEIIKAQEKYKKNLTVCHVLRYAPFFQTIKNITDSKELGEIQNIDLTEKIAYWHFAHSYVRGNWRKEKESSPIILSKSCHDLDIISWLINSKPQTVFSQGSLRFFKKENAPKNSLERCTDGCQVDCLWDARKFYLNQRENAPWPYKTISLTNTSEKARKKAIEKGQYGKCVFKCDNDVCDTQDVLIGFEKEIRANFMLRSGGDDLTRKIYIQFEKGEIYGDLRTGEIIKIKYNARKDQIKKQKINIKAKGGHGGGDERLIENFIKSLKTNFKENLTSARKSLQSHLLAFASEKSRHSGKVINFKKYQKEFR